MAKTKSGIVGLMQGIKAKVQDKVANNEIEHACKILGTERVHNDHPNKELNPHAELILVNNTYALAFKALHCDTQEEMGLKPEEITNAFYSTSIVFTI